jgi:hypothetical protein
MSTSKLPEAFSYAGPADVDLSAKLHYFAKKTATGIDLAGDGTVVIGTLIEVAAAGYGVTVQFGGIGKVIAAEAIAANARIASDADGKAVNAATGDFEVGTALVDATCSAGDIIPFIFASGRKHA